MKDEPEEGHGDVHAPEDLGIRTKRFALRVIRLHCALPRTVETQVIGRQLLRSGTSVGAQYREALRARSDAEFISKIEGSLQELEESAYWMELLVEAASSPRTDWWISWTKHDSSLPFSSHARRTRK